MVKVVYHGQVGGGGFPERVVQKDGWNMVHGWWLYNKKAVGTFMTVVQYIICREMRRALMIVDHFPPSFAPRMGYLAKYMKELGWDGRVYAVAHSRDTAKFDTLTGYIAAEEVPMPVYSRRHSINRLAAEVLGRLCGGRGWSMNDERMYHHIMNSIDGRYDVVLCSTASFFPLLCAQRVARRLGLPLVLDFRDIYEQDPYMYPAEGLAGALRKRQIKLRNNAIGRADAVVSVSEWHRKHLGQYNSNSYLIYNGYDSDTFVHTPPQPTRQFTISYTGSVAPTNCEGSRNPEVLFEAISRLAGKGIGPEQLRLRFYTDDASRLYLGKVGTKYNINEYLDINAWVPLHEVPQILEQSNALLVLVAAANTHGIMTTKVFEYLAAERPIICVPDSRCPVAQLIEQAGAGAAFDSADSLCQYLEHIYNEWATTGVVKCDSKREYIQQFSRRQEAAEFTKILDAVVEKKLPERGV